MPKPPAKHGISWRKVILSDVVPDDGGEYVAASAGDSPFTEGAALRAGMVLPAGRTIPAWKWAGVPDEPPIPFEHEVVRREAHYMVAWKPHFLPTTSNGRIVAETLQTRLRVAEDNPHIAPCHRLDRLTAGHVLCSTEPAHRGAYQQLFERREVTKTYRAHVNGEHGLSHTPRTIELGMRKDGNRVVVDPLGKQTVTTVRALSDREVELIPHTGHTHQLRVLMNHLGAPIDGDDTYPKLLGRGLYDFSVPLQLLAVKLDFNDPVSNSRQQIIRE